MRVHEELLAGGAELSYAALTAFCRRHGIGYAPPAPAGQYDFVPVVAVPSPVLSVGHFRQALLGHSCQAP
ncbi:MAG TPA: hypothetical protein VKJ01_19670, partial [Candidatus Solibacter sp.]|nr:hypothetical protein [Candidatus Solibacter sp.]